MSVSGNLIQVGDLGAHTDGSWELADSSRKEMCREVIPDAPPRNLVCLMSPRLTHLVDFERKGIMTLPV